MLFDCVFCSSLTVLVRLSSSTFRIHQITSTDFGPNWAKKCLKNTHCVWAGHNISVHSESLCTDNALWYDYITLHCHCAERATHRYKSPHYHYDYAAATTSHYDYDYATATTSHFDSLFQNQFCKWRSAKLVSNENQFCKWQSAKLVSNEEKTKPVL